MVEAQSPAALPRGARKAARVASASIRSFFAPKSSSPNPQNPEIADEKPGPGADDADFDVPTPGKRKKKKNESPRKPENRKARKKLLEKLKDGDDVEPRADNFEAEPITDLRKEARAAAEEYAVLSAGKPVHPFFLRKNVEQQPAMNEGAVNPESLLGPLPPFHVLQSSQDFSKPSWNASVFKFDVREQSSFKLGDGDFFRLLSTDQSSTRVSRREVFLEPLEPLKTSTEIHTHSKPEEKTDNNDLWTDYYQPRSAEEICGNRESVALLNDWLRLWKQRVLTKKPEFSPSKPRLDDDFQEDGYDDVDEEDDGLETTLLLTGPVGCGKSAAVYACANEQGFNVIEINASDNRNGAAIRHTVGEASESQALNWCSLDFENSENKMTMILFEEVDTVFEEDRGFVAALVKLAKTAKRPIILTSNCPQPLVPFSRRISFSKPAVEDLVAHACLVCSSRGVLSPSPEIMKQIVETHEQDLRKLLLALQFWSQGSSPASEHPLELLNTSTSTNTPFESLQLQLNPVSFHCSFTQKLAGTITSAAEEAEKLNLEALVERFVARASAEAQAQRAARKLKIQQRRASLESGDKPKTQPGKKRRRLKKLGDMEMLGVESSEVGSGEDFLKRCETGVTSEIMNTGSGEVFELKTQAGAQETGVSFEVRAGEELAEMMNTGSGEVLPGVTSAGEVFPEMMNFGSGEVFQVELQTGAQELGVTSESPDAMNGEVFSVRTQAGAQAPEMMNTGSGEVSQVKTFRAFEEASTGFQQVEPAEAFDPVKTQWLELKTPGKNLLGEFEGSLEKSGLKVVEALASACDVFSSSDVMSRVDDPEFSSHLAQRSLGHVLKACSGFMSEFVEKPSFYNPPWDKQRSRRINRQKILEEEIFLTHPKMSRHCFTVPGFCDYISLMARIAKLEEIQKAENLRPKKKRSRGYQDEYLVERNVSRQGINALRELFVFDNTYKLTD